MLELRLNPLRYRIACGTAVIAAAGAIAACGASSNATSGFSGGADAGGIPEDGPTLDADSSPSDGGAEAAAPIAASVTFVHASPSLNDARLCWTLHEEAGAAGALTSAAPFPSGAPMPASNFPGLPVGGAVQLSPATNLATASLAGAVDLYAIDAELLAREVGVGAATTAQCKALVCLGNPNPNPELPCLRPNKDYWHVGTLPVGAIATSGPTFVALAGCMGTALDPAASESRCGSSWDAVTGNLHVEVLHVAAISSGATSDATAPAEGGALWVQSALLSPALASSLADSGAVRVSFGTGADASAFALLSNEGEVEPSRPATLAIGTDLAAFGQLGFGLDAVGSDAGASTHFWTSLAQAQSLIDPTADPRLYFRTGVTYLALVMGDPQAPSPLSGGDAAYDGRGLHVLVLASLPAH